MSCSPQAPVRRLFLQWCSISVLGGCGIIWRWRLAGRNTSFRVGLWMVLERPRFLSQGLLLDVLWCEKSPAHTPPPPTFYFPCLRGGKSSATVSQSRISPPLSCFCQVFSHSDSKVTNADGFGSGLGRIKKPISWTEPQSCFWACENYHNSQQSNLGRL